MSQAAKTMSMIGLGLMTLTSVMIAMHAFGFQLRISGDPLFHARFDEVPIRSSMHVIGGGIVLLTGAFQFWPWLRRTYPAFHRASGRVYLSFVLIGGIGGLLMAPISDGGLVAHFGFGILAVIFLFSGWQAYSAIRAGNVASHRAWMMRNFSMAFGAVTLRIYLGLFAVAGVPFEESYPLVSWLAWVPNLILVEWYLVMSANRRPAGQKAADAAPQPA